MLLLLLTLSASDSSQVATCYIDSGTAFVRANTLDTTGVAWAWWAETLNSTGFNHITIETNPSFDSPTQLFCAGFIDSYLTQHRIWERFQLYKDIANVSRTSPFPTNWTDWLQHNLAYMRSSVAASPGDPYWRNVGYVLRQFDGLVAGYRSTAPAAETLTEMDLLIIQSIGDLSDISKALERPPKRDETFGMECSGLVRMGANMSDVFFAHNTWSDFRTLTLIVKEYHFEVAEWTAKRVVVATKMGALPSSTDFWLTDRGLLILETTNGNYNDTLYDRLTPASLLTWVRTLIASWTADSGLAWADGFLRENSGTYNNQYVIVDAKKFTPGEPPASDFVWSTFNLLTRSH